MDLRRISTLLAVSFFAVLICANSVAQVSTTAPGNKAGNTQPFIIPRPPIPADPLELATGATKVLDTPQDRTTLLNLLERARQNSDLWGPGKPYVLKTSYSSSGAAAYTGSGEMTQIWMSPARWRFDAQIAGYTQTRLANGPHVYDLRSNSFVPIRLQMVRNVVFWPVNFAPRAMLRVAAGKLGETDLLCGLFSGAANDPVEMSAVPGRRWVEIEYCVEPNTGLLRVFSEAPGIYAVYDYSDALQFNGHVLPRSVTVTEAGQTVLNVRLENMADPTPQDIAQLTPSAELASAGIGNPLSFPLRWQQLTPLPAGYKGEVHPVIVHAILGPDGRALDQEALQTQDAQLTQAAMDLVRNSTYGAANVRAARSQREVFINVKFTEPVTTAAKP